MKWKDMEGADYGRIGVITLECDWKPWCKRRNISGMMAGLQVEMCTQSCRVRKSAPHPSPDPLYIMGLNVDTANYTKVGYLIVCP
jgi:hypothetical protein